MPVLEMILELEKKYPKAWDSFNKSGTNSLPPFPLQVMFFNLPITEEDRRTILFAYLTKWGGKRIQQRIGFSNFYLHIENNEKAFQEMCEIILSNMEELLKYRS